MVTNTTNIYNNSFAIFKYKIVWKFIDSIDIGLSFHIN